MRIFISALLGFLIQLHAYSQSVFDVTKYGAVGDNKSINTKAIQKAIDDCHAKGGGKVYFPQGVFISGTLVLKSYVTIYLSENATLKGSPNISDYPDFSISEKTRIEHIIGSTKKQFLFAENAENIAIDGYGTFHPNGEAFQDHIDESPNRPYGLRFVNCKYVTVSNIHMRNSAYWMQRYLHCDYVKLTGLKVWNHCNLNNDGMDIDGCRDVVVSDCFVDSSDDGICLKSEGNRTCENVVVTNCVVSSFASGLKLGTGSLGGFKRVAFSNCIVKPSRAKIMSHNTGSWGGLAGIDILEVDGANTEFITFNNIIIDSVDCPIFIKLGNRNAKTHKEDESYKKSKMSFVALSNIQVKNAGSIASAITGYPGKYIENLSLENIQIHTRGEGTDRDTSMLIPEYSNSYPVSGMFGSNLPAYGFYFRHVNGLKMRNISLISAAKDQRPVLAFDDVLDAYISQIDAKMYSNQSDIQALRFKNCDTNTFAFQSIYINQKAWELNKNMQKSQFQQNAAKTKLPPIDSALVFSIDFNKPNWKDFFEDTEAEIVKAPFGQSISFSGKSFLKFKNVDFRLKGDVSFSIWMKVANPDSKKYYRIFSNRKAWNEPNGIELEISPGNKRLNFSGGNTGMKDQGLAQIDYDAEWHHYVGTIADGRFRLYVDGKLVAWDDYTAPAGNSELPLVIGANALGGDKFEGQLGRIMLWNRALSAYEVPKLAK